jgi:hypothetical protein
VSLRRGPLAKLERQRGAHAAQAALVHADLGSTYPVSGGTARFPYMIFGALGGFTGGWMAWIHAAYHGASSPSGPGSRGRGLGRTRRSLAPAVPAHPPDTRSARRCTVGFRDRCSWTRRRAEPSRIGQGRRLPQAACLSRSAAPIGCKETSTPAVTRKSRLGRC